MKQLWIEASTYGRVYLTTLADGCFYCTITFNTIKHVELKAQSSTTCVEPEQALREAIYKAKEIIDSISETSQKLKELANGKSTAT